MFLITLENFSSCRDGQATAVVYFRAGYTPRDYPSESVSNCFILLLLAVAGDLFCLGIRIKLMYSFGMDLLLLPCISVAIHSRKKLTFLDEFQ